MFPLMQCIPSILIKVIDDQKSILLIDFSANHMELIQELFKGVSSIKKFTKSIASDYIIKGMPKYLCDSIIADEQKTRKFLDNIMSFLDSQYTDEMIRSLEYRLYNEIGKLHAPSLIDEMKEKMKKSENERILSAFRIMIRAYGEGIDDALVVKGVQLKPVKQFYGRIDALVSIKTCLDKTGKAIICGKHGLGKKTLAEKYAYDNKKSNNYDVVLISDFGTGAESAANNIVIKKKVLASAGVNRRESGKFVLSILNGYKKRVLMIVKDADLQTALSEKTEFDVIYIIQNNEPVQENESIINLAELPDELLKTILINDLSGKEREEVSSHAQDTIALLLHNTYAVKLFAKTVRSGVCSAKALKEKLETGQEHKGDIHKVFKTLISFSNRSKRSRQILGIFAMLCSYPIKEALARKLFGGLFTEIEKAVKCGLLIRERRYGETLYSMPSVIAYSIKEERMIAKNYKDAINAVSHYASNWQVNKEIEAAFILRSISDGIQGSSAELTEARGKIITWAVQNEIPDAAEVVYENYSAKKTQPYNMTLLLGTGIVEQDQKDINKAVEHADIIAKKRLNIAALLIEKNKREKFIEWTTNYRSERLEFDKMMLPAFISNAWELLRTHDHSPLSVVTGLIKKITWSYKTHIEFETMSEEPDNEHFVKYIKRAYNTPFFKDTDIYRTAEMVYGEGKAEEFLGNTENFKALVGDMIVLVCLEHYYCDGSTELVSLLCNFISTERGKITKDTELKWLTETIYALIENPSRLPTAFILADRNNELLGKMDLASPYFIYGLICQFFYEGLRLYVNFDRKNGSASGLYDIYSRTFLSTLLLIKDYGDDYTAILLLLEKYALLLSFWCDLIPDSDYKKKLFMSYEIVVQNTRKFLIVSNDKNVVINGQEKIRAAVNELIDLLLQINTATI